MELEAGDHIKADYGLYEHHGIYEGDGKVIAYSKEQKRVVRTSLNVFGQGHEIFLVMHDDAKFSRSEIVARAQKRLDEAKYNLVFNNCEHFANWCVTDKAKSDQVRTAAIDAVKLALLGYKLYTAYEEMKYKVPSPHTFKQSGHRHTFVSMDRIFGIRGLNLKVRF